MKNGIIVALIAAIAIGSALGALAATRTIQTEVAVEVKVWESVRTGNLYLSTRPDGGEWTTHNTPLDMSQLNDAETFYQSSSVLVTVPVELEVEVPDPTEPSPEPTEEPTATPEPEPGTCCEVRGMTDRPDLRAAALAEMQAVVQFGDHLYDLQHRGPITIHIVHTNAGLFARYKDAFGFRPETLPSECSFQEGEHIFFGAACRLDTRAYATEWFRRAGDAASVDPVWIAQGTTAHFASHYVDGHAPRLEEHRFQRTLYFDRPVDLRTGVASDRLMTLAVEYAIEEHGLDVWLDVYRSMLASGDAEAAFGEVLRTSLDEFYDDFEAWADAEYARLQAAAFESCEAAGGNVILQGGTPGVDAGYPDYRVPGEVDEDGDGIVCEGFVPLRRP